MRESVKKTPFVSSIVLAAGSSTRMAKQNKLALDIDGQPMLLRVIEILQKGGVDETIVVVGRAVKKLTFLREKDVRIVENSAYREGMAASIRCGVRHLNAQSHAVFIALGDMPFVQPATIRGMGEQIRSRTVPAILYPFYKNKQGNPVLFSQHFYRDLLQLHGDRGAKSIIRQHPSAAQPFACDDPGVLLDIDTPEDYRQYINGVSFL